MRRLLIYGFLAVVVVLALAAYWLSHREIVVDRAVLGGPPPASRPHANLVGRRLPAFTAVDQNSQPVRTMALQGRVVVINVWATWCQPCVTELPRVEREIWQRFRSEVTVIAVAQGESAQEIRDFNRRMNLTFSLVEDPKQKIARTLGGDNVIPRTYVVDRQGVIVHQTIGYGESEFAHLVSTVERTIAQR